MRFDPKHPEFASVEVFVQFLTDDERTTFFPGEAQAVSVNTGKTQRVVTAEIMEYGFQPIVGANKNPGRGFLSNPNGTHPFQANPTYATSGSDNIQGFAGRS